MKRKSGRAIKLWSPSKLVTTWFQYAEREDGVMFFRYLECSRWKKWGQWKQCSKDPRRADGTIPGGFETNLELRTEGLGRIRLPVGRLRLPK